jgi:hypothetical protein
LLCCFVYIVYNPSLTASLKGLENPDFITSILKDRGQRLIVLPPISLHHLVSLWVLLLLPMAYSPFSQEKTARLSNSPAGTPRLVQAPASPVQSVHLDMMEDSLHGGQALRDDFFDSSSREGVIIAAEVILSTEDTNQQQDRRCTSSSHKERTSYLGGATASDYISHCQDDVRLGQQTANFKPKGVTELSDSSTLEPYHFLKLTHSPCLPMFPPHRPPPGPRNETSWYEEEDSTPVATEAKPLSIQSPGQGRIVHHSSPRGSTIIEVNDVESSAVAVAAVEATNRAIKDIHTQTMQALMHNNQAGVNQISFLPDSDCQALQSTIKKRVSLAPPPIEIASHTGSVPDNIVRTPYPFLFRKTYSKPSPLRTSANLEHESILVLSIRRCETSSNRPRRVSKISIPGNVDAPPPKMSSSSDKTKQKHFDSLDFDDAHFFHELRKTYRHLAGPYRFFSARRLQYIDISHSITCSDKHSLEFGLRSRTASFCSHDFPRSPRFLASRGLTDSFSAAELMKHYNNPKIGKARYAWVHWAHRISSVAPQIQSPASAPPADSPAARLASSKATETDHMVGDGGCAAGLEFVEGWCAWIISVAVVSVVLCALAAALCWIFLGPNMFILSSGYRNFGERVEGGCLLGAFVLMIGWSGLIGWATLSWLVE